MIAGPIMSRDDKLKGKLRLVWSRLDEQEVDLYTSGKHDRFFGLLEEKHGVPRAEAKDRLEEIKASCGGASSAAEKAA